MTETTAVPPSAPLFVRPRDGRMLTGVCAGVAARWGLDVTLVRIVTVVLALVSGIGIVAYVAAWLLTPSVDGPAPLAADGSLAASMGRRGGRFVRVLPRLLLFVLLGALLVGLVHSLWFGVPVVLVTVLALVAIAVGTRLGRWVLAAVAGLVVLAIAAVLSFGASLGSRTLHVGSVTDLRSTYDYGTGQVRLDLSGIGNVQGEHETNVHLGRGDVTVTLPPGVPVLVRARAGLGSVAINGHRVSGIDAEQTVPIGSGTATAVDRLVVDVTVGAGSVKVTTG